MAKNTKATKSADDKVGDEYLQKVRKSSKQITTSSTAEYFSKNLQQVGFSSPVKAVLTTLKEALDNSLDACEDAGILPDIVVKVERLGAGTLKNTDQILISVEDNGPGIDPEDIPKVFGEYLASSKFGRGRCSRGQQGIGISAATTWAMQTTARGAMVTTKQKTQRKAVKCIVDMDLKNNKGIVRDKETIEWKKESGTLVEFRLDGRIQLNGEGGLLAYLRGTILLNPHMQLTYTLTDVPKTKVDRVTKEVPAIPEATEPHPHTMKLGEFMAHGRLFGHIKTSVWLKKGFARLGDAVQAQICKEQKLKPEILNQFIDTMPEDNFKALYAAIQNAKLPAPPTNTVMAVGEEGLALSIRRLGDVDYFAVVTRKPMIADFKPVQVEVAIARLKERAGEDQENPVQVLRFANRVPLQFDKASCAIVKALTTVNWRSYGIRQPKDSLPLGPFIVAVSLVSPFIKFKNASKETIDASDELVEEIRRAIMQAGQRLSRYLKRENKADELEQRVQHIEQFGPILIETLARILNAPDARKERAKEGLAKILQKDTKGIKKDLDEAHSRLSSFLEEKQQKFANVFSSVDDEFKSEKAAKAAAKAALKAAAEGPAAEEPAAEDAEAEAEAKPAAKKKAPAKKKTKAK
jgi:DNA topoisomerase-6 subunit B